VTPDLKPEQFEQIQNLIAECSNPCQAPALAAELFMLRKLHREALKIHRAPLHFIQIMNRLPRMVADIAAWKRAVSEARPRYERYRALRDGTEIDITGK
jgi:hypothetical protein